VDRDPEERREEPRGPSDRSPGETNEGREGNRRGQQVPPARETSEAWEEPFPHGEERPQDGLTRTWWRRIFRGPHHTPPGRRSWWRRVFGG
jgi:hypothetical protein